MNMHARPSMMSVRGSEALVRLLDYPDAYRILDVGSGTGQHAALMRASGCDVVTVSYEPPADHVCDYVGNRQIGGGFDAIWASHVIEHQPNVNMFLRQCFQDLREDGILAVTVPPMKQDVVGGHLTCWNAGILLYNLIIAGFDCREARVSPLYSSGPGFPPYNISVIVRKREAILPSLRFDSGDIERLAEFFPCPVHQGFDGRLQGINW